MYKQIISIIKDICLRYKDIETFKYQDSCFNNQQNSHKGFQVYVDDVTLSELNIETDIFKISYEIFILNSEMTYWRIKTRHSISPLISWHT